MLVGPEVGAAVAMAQLVQHAVVGEPLGPKQAGLPDGDGLGAAEVALDEDGRDVRGDGVGLREAEVLVGGADETGPDQVGKLDLAAANVALVHKTVLVLLYHGGAGVDETLTGRAHDAGQDGSRGDRGADRKLVFLRRQGAGAKDRQRAVPTRVSEMLLETHLDRAGSEIRVFVVDVDFEMQRGSRWWEGYQFARPDLREVSVRGLQS